MPSNTYLSFSCTLYSELDTKVLKGHFEHHDTIKNVKENVAIEEKNEKNL